MGTIRKFIDTWNKMMYILTPTQKGWGVIVFVLSLIGSIMELFGISILLPVVQVILEPTQLQNSVIVSDLMGALGLEYTDTKELLVFFMTGMLVVYIAKNLYLIFLSYIRSRYSLKILREVSIDIVSSYVKRGYYFFKSSNQADLLRGCQDYVGGVQAIIFDFYVIVTDILTIICILGYMFVVDSNLVLATIMIAAISVLLTVRVLRPFVKKSGKAYFEKISANNKNLFQFFGGIKEILVLNREDKFKKRYEQSYLQYQKARIVQTMATGTPSYVIEIICIIFIVAVMFYNLQVNNDPTSFLPELAIFGAAVLRLKTILGSFSQYFNEIVYYMPGLDETYKNVREANLCDEEYNKLYNARLEKIGDSKLTLDNQIEIKNLEYKYPDGNKSILENINITIKDGEAIAFVGPSGAGKSTLADVFLGLLQPNKGGVFVDGKDVYLYREDWAKMIGFVPQSVYLLDESVRSNVAFGMNPEDIDDEFIWAALEQAQLKEYVESLPEGLDTVVGERGVKFSGGQSQRLAIARALYSNPRIIVFDEATSALDNTTEAAVMESIERLQHEKVLIIIAHRLSTVEKCDRIYEIKDGLATQVEYEELIRKTEKE